MWKRDEAVRPSQPSVSNPVTASTDPATVRTEVPRHSERDMVNIGKSVIIKGELSGSEDLTIEGQVDGKIELRQNVLTIGANAKIKAQVFAKAIVIMGEVHGNISASDKVEIKDNGSVDGDISSPRVAIADGAHFRGSIDMQRQGGKGAAEAKPAAEGKSATSTVASPSGANVTSGAAAR